MRKKTTAIYASIITVFAVFAIAGLVIMLVSKERLKNNQLTEADAEHTSDESYSNSKLPRPNSRTEFRSPVQERTVGEIVSNDSRGAKATTDEEELRSEIHMIIGSEHEPRWRCDYGTVVSHLNESAVPLLTEMLNDKDYKNRWASIGHMIAWLGDKSDPAIVDTLINYIQRTDTWNSSQGRTAGTHLFWKEKLVCQLGLFEVDRAMNVLNSAFEPQGARSLIENWVNYPHKIENYDSRVEIISVQGQAARGLILTRNAAAIARVADKYEQYVHKALTVEHRTRALDENVQLEYQLHSFIINSLAENDLIEDIGIDEFLKSSGTEAGDYLLLEKLYRYRGRIVDDGRVVYEICPLCGKSS